MKLLRIPDANTGGESSSSSAAPATEVQTDQSANPSEVKINTSIDKEKGFDPQSIAEQIKAKYATKEEKSTESVESLPSEKSKEESGSVKEPNQEKKEEPKVEEKIPDEKLPFHNHPRFKQVIEERNKFEAAVKQYEEPAQRMGQIEKFCNENNISAQEFDDSVRLAAFIKKDSKAALEQLKKVVSELEVSVGNALPKDLQARVDEGKISQTDAQEIAQLRVKASGAEASVKRNAQTSAQEKQRELVQSLDSWTASKIKSDPSFKPKTNGDEDGKYELVTDKFLALWQQKEPKTASEAITLAEQAYKSVHDFIERNLPKTPQRRPLSPKRNEQPTDAPIDITKPNWAREAAKRAGVGRG